MLDGTVDSDASTPGEAISAKLRQEVPLPGGRKIKRESKILGHVVAVSAASDSGPYQITIKFEQIEVDKKPVGISAGLRAFATMELVAQSRQPANANGGNGTSVWDLNMSQIGGQIAYNGQKIVKGSADVAAAILVPIG